MEDRSITKVSCTTKELEQIFKALSDTTRLRILNLLLQGELCVCDIQLVLGSPQPNVSRHLTYLKNSGLVQDRREGPRIYYSIVQSRTGAPKDLFGFLPDLFSQSRLLKDDLRKLNRTVERPRRRSRNR